MSKVFDKLAVDKRLADLADAYELISEIAKTSRGNSKSKQYALLALPLIENGFDSLSHYGNQGQSVALKERIEQARILPVLSG